MCRQNKTRIRKNRILATVLFITWHSSSYRVYICCVGFENQQSAHLCSVTVILPKYRLKCQCVKNEVWWVCCRFCFDVFFTRGIQHPVLKLYSEFSMLSLISIYLHKPTEKKKMFVQKEGNHMGRDRVSTASQEIWYLLVLTNWVIFQWCNRPQILVLLLSSCSCQQHHVMFAISRVRDQQRTYAINDKWTRELHFFLNGNVTFMVQTSVSVKTKWTVINDN